MKRKSGISHQTRERDRYNNRKRFREEKTEECGRHPNASSLPCPCPFPPHYHLAAVDAAAHPPGPACCPLAAAVAAVVVTLTECTTLHATPLRIATMNAWDFASNLAGGVA